MHRHCGYCTLLLILFIVVTGAAQGTYTVTGTVVDASTNKPLPGVNVYFNNTTIGAATDEQGVYVIGRISTDLRELYFSSVGFKPAHVQLAPPPKGAVATVNARLVPTVHQLTPVTINSKGNWAARYRVFKRIFLGETPNASKTEILNPQVLDFDNIEEHSGREGFTANASAPLEMENRALGYHLTVEMEQFKTVKGSYEIVMSTRFTPLKPRNERELLQWKTNRLDAYKGSELHLFRSIVKGRYQQEGFTVYRVSEQQDTASAVPAAPHDLIIDTTRADIKILRKGSYRIEYHNKVLPISLRKSLHGYLPVSIIKVDDTYLRLYADGQVKQPSNYWRLGYLYDFRMGDLLPSDYDAIIEEGQLTLSARRELGSVHGTVIDTEGNPLKNVEVFVNNGLAGTQTNAWGQFELTGLDPGNYQVAFVEETKQVDTRQLMARATDTIEVKVVLQDREVYDKMKGATSIDDDRRDAFLNLFHKSVLRESGRWNFQILNPQVLQFARKGKVTKVWTTGPLELEHIRLGYRWTYYDPEITIERRHASVQGVVKIDTIESRSIAQKYRSSRYRMEQYVGSWNHLTTSLFDGRADGEGFHFYQQKKSFAEDRPYYEKLTEDVLTKIDSDSLLIRGEGNMLLHVRPGLEVRNENRKVKQRFYKGISDQILRLRSDTSLVALAYCGSFDAGQLNIEGADRPLVPLVPADFRIRNSPSSPEVIVYIQEENLKAVKNLLEKTYLQTDRSYYYPGDTIWFKAYVRYANLLYRDSLSRVLYVDLLSPQGELLNNAVLRIEDGVTWGDLALASGLPAGDYYLRVYTRWMQNFNEFFIQPLPVIGRNRFLEAATMDSLSWEPEGLQVLLTTDKNQYNTRDKITASLQVLRAGVPAPSSYSVSVTDMSAVADLDGVPNITLLGTPFKAANAKIIRLPHAVEHGLALQGEIRPSSEKSRHTITAVLINSQQAVEATVIGPKFSIPLDFYDTTTAVLRSQGQAGTHGRIEVNNPPPVTSYDLPSPLEYRYANDVQYQYPVPGREVTVLREVTVGAKPILPGPSETLVTPTQRSFGMAYQILQGGQLESIRLRGDLADYLLMHLPRFRETYCWINYRQGCGSSVPGARSFQSAASSGGVENLPLTVYRIFMNGHPLSPLDFGVIPAQRVSRIEVYWEPGPYFIKRVAIYTEPMFPYWKEEVQRFMLRGYDIPNTFPEPPTDRSMPDYRPTLYWKPDGRIEKTGPGTFSFAASDVDGTYKVTLEGLTDEGEPFRMIRYLSIGR
jgi:protocatechuate 3,4-dioxygenase beta subunit